MLATHGKEALIHVGRDLGPGSVLGHACMPPLVSFLLAQRAKYLIRYPTRNQRDRKKSCGTGRKGQQVDERQPRWASEKSITIVGLGGSSNGIVGVVSICAKAAPFVIGEAGGAMWVRRLRAIRLSARPGCGPVSALTRGR
ncbi:hypothetical protein DCS_06860 [Drechmeria coniospora]|uniref:Uncharacterized protein n=1 Tax=Drechmeria coniospora TaxID=98403 RepID=A0A151GCS5_DRECN|nr:hypothetical protein DCS_06860 [Drechmeria coniospora]KYK54899.1 hypothetical protein DCS_06860 [Drechmeria coniospora]